MHIGILTGGGDVPGLNPCIQALVEAACNRGWHVTGFKRGWRGVLDIDPDALPATLAHGARSLTVADVRGIDRTGGTLLHTSRTDPRREPSGDATPHVRAVLEALKIDALVTLGGDGTLKFSAHLAQLGVPVIGIPKTMDNDVPGTDYCLGFSTAITRSVDAINALRTTTASHERIAIVELFGRRSGETALLSGFLARADRTVIAEVPADPDALAALLAQDRTDNPEHYAMLVVSEGATLVGESTPPQQRIGRRLAAALESRLNVGTIVQELAYLMRSGAPDALDRMVGFGFGHLTVQLLARGETGRLISLKDGNYSHTPLTAVTAAAKQVNIPALYDPQHYRARLATIEGMPMFLY